MQTKELRFRNGKYSKDLMRKALRRCEDIPVSRACKELQVPYSTLKYWYDNYSLEDIDNTKDFYHKNFYKIEQSLVDQIEELTKKLNKFRKARAILDGDDVTQEA